MKKILNYSENRPLYINIIFCLISLIGILLLPSVFFLLLNKIIHNNSVCSILSEIIFILLLYFMYYKDLNREFITYKRNFKSIFKDSIRKYFLGFAGMIIFNLFIAIFIKSISSNESQVREMLYNNVIITMISISIFAPISEEIIFRKSLQPIVKNKYLYIVLCGLLFGCAHIATNILSNSFSLIDLIYILPYASLGSSFALMDYDNKTTFASIIIHALHNTCTALLLLVVYFGGLHG